jgi:hypothetical protein
MRTEGWHRRIADDPLTNSSLRSSCVGGAAKQHAGSLNGGKRHESSAHHGKAKAGAEDVKTPWRRSVICATLSGVADGGLGRVCHVGGSRLGVKLSQVSSSAWCGLLQERAHSIRYLPDLRAIAGFQFIPMGVLVRASGSR